LALPYLRAHLRTMAAILRISNHLLYFLPLPLWDTSWPFLKGGFMAKKSKKRRAWTATEVRELKTMAKKKTAASQIARKLKRTEGATRQKAFSIGLSLDSRS